MSYSAEDSLLSVLLSNNEAYWRVAGIVVPEDFSAKGRRIYAAIADAVKASEKADFITIGNEYGEDMGNEAMQIACNVAVSVSHVESYARLVAEAGELVRVRDAGKRISTVRTYAEAQALLAAVRPQQSARLKSATDGLREMMEALQIRFAGESVVTGTATGLGSLDEITGGWQPGDLIGLGGETSSGKTAAAIQAAIAAGRCYYGSLEMMAAQLSERAVSNIGQIPYRWLRFPREAPDWFVSNDGLGRPEDCTTMTLLEASAVVQKLPIILDDQPGLTCEQFCSRARQLHMVEPLKLIVADHLNLFRRPRKNDAAELGEIAIALKNLAKELGVPVMVLVQLNRAQKQRADRRPELQDFRNSGEIEEALDTAVMVYRDEYHNPNGPLKGYAEFIVRKQRQGERNVTAWAKSYLSQMRFESCDEPEQRPAANAAANDGRGGFASRFAKGGQQGAVSRVGRDD
jgi:replicative DNA helicase